MRSHRETSRSPWFLVALLPLLGCSAAPAPCLIQRPPLGGYTIKMTLQGTPPAGCEAVLPPIYADNWRLDGYADRTIYAKADSMPYPDKGGDPDPTHAVLGKGTLSEAPDAQNLCTIPELSVMRADVDPLGIGNPVYAYHARNIRLLDGARYQGSEFQADIDVTFGDCTGTYSAQALTPSQAGGTCATDDDCSPFSDPAAGRATGSGINPDYAVACLKEDWVTNFVTGDPTTGICFFTKPFPGLK